MLIMPAQLNIIADALHYYADGCDGGGLDAEVMPLPLSCARPHVYIIYGKRAVGGYMAVAGEFNLSNLIKKLKKWLDQ